MSQDGERDGTSDSHAAIEAMHRSVVQAISPWIARTKRPAWTPVVAAGGQSEAPERLSQFGGAPAQRRRDGAPKCGDCGGPMDLFLQLDGRETPAGAPWSGPSVLQFFYCTACDAPNPFSPAHAFRVLPAQSVIAAPPDADAGQPRRAIVGWTAFEDSPSAGDFEAQGLSMRFDLDTMLLTLRCKELGLTMRGLDADAQDKDGRRLVDAIPAAREGDKFGGWPAWIQGEDPPRCERCGELMRQLFQIDYGGGLEYMFGDAGCSHLLQCPKHQEVFAFLWGGC